MISHSTHRLISCIAALVISSGACLAVPTFDVDLKNVEFPAGDKIAPPTAPAMAGGVSVLATEVRAASGANISVSKVGLTDSSTGEKLTGPAIVIEDISPSARAFIAFDGHRSDEATAGRVSVAFDLLLDSVSTHAFTLVVRNAQGATITGLQFHPTNGSIVQMDHDKPGSFRATRTFAKAGSFGVGRPQNVNIDINISEASIQVRIDGTIVGKGQLPPSSGFAGIKFETGSSWKTTFAISNIRIKDGDEARGSTVESPPTPEQLELAAGIGSDDARAVYAALQRVRDNPSAAPVVIRAIAERLSHVEVMIRLAAAEALLSCGPDAQLAVDALAQRAKSDPNDKVRGTAAAALARSGPRAFGHLRQMLLGPDKSARLTAASAVRSAGGEISPELEQLVAWASPPIVLDTNPSLHPNSGFEADDSEAFGWTIEMKDGSEGNWAIDTRRSLSGRNSIRLTKTNGVGYINLRSKHPIVLPPGKEVITSRLWFHTEDAPISAALLFMLEDHQGKLIPGDGARSGFSWQSQTLMRNAPPHAWEKRVLMLKGADHPREYYVHVLLYGNPCTVWIDDIETPSATWNLAMSSSTPSVPRHSAQEAAAIIEKAPEVRARVITQEGAVRVTLGDEVSAAVLHMPFRPLVGDYAPFDQAGVALQTVMIELNDFSGEFTPGSTGVTGKAAWPSGGSKQYDFTEAMRRIEHALRQAPQTNLMLGFNVTWPRDYVTHHPDTLWIDAHGKKAHGTWLYFKGFANELPAGDIWWPSPYLDQPVQDAADVIAAFVKHLQQTPYHKRLAGVFVSGGHDGQFFIRDRDYSPAATQAWRQWLEKKYKTDSALAKAWGRQGLTFNAAEVPVKPKPVSGDADGSPMFYDPAGEHAQRDYEEYRTERMWRVKETLVQAARQAAGKPIIGLAWHMGGGLTGHIEPLLNSEVLDGCIVQSSYEYRYPGYPSRSLAAHQSFARHGKLLIREMDTRSWVRETYRNEISTMKISTPLSAAQFRSEHRKEIGQSIAHDQGWWYFDISDNAFRHPSMMNEIARTRRMYQRLSEQPRRHRPDVVVVYSNDSFLWGHITHFGFRNLPAWMFTYEDLELSTSGVPRDNYYIDDLMKLPHGDEYKVYIFANTYYVTQAQREFINRLKGGNRTLIWHYAPGYLGESRMSADLIGELTGIKTRTLAGLHPQRAITVSTTDSLARGLRPLQGMGDIFRAHFRLDDDPAFDPQRFVIDDANATILARYADDNSGAIAVKRFADWTSIYAASLAGLSAELINNAATEAGAYVAAAAGTAVEINDRFLSVHALRGGPLTVKLPGEGYKVRRFDDEHIVAENAAQVTLDAQAQETYWFELMK